MERILLIDDDRDLCALVSQYLELEGFTPECAYTPQEGIARALSGECAFVVLDVNLPGMTGFDVLRRIRAAAEPIKEIPVLMLTARRQETDRVVGLELGADDYLAKPFSARELTARIRAILRRSNRPGPTAPAPIAPPGREILVIDDLELDGAAHKVRVGGRTITLTALEFDVLRLLMRNQGIVVTREEISQQALGRPLMRADRSVDMHVSNLRRKLGPHPDGSERLGTVRSVGYVYQPAAFTG